MHEYAEKKFDVDVFLGLAYFAKFVVLENLFLV
jgi:hypothetical protein